jgi:hypothetical protein
MATNGLTREDWINIIIALKSQIEKWQKYVAYDSTRFDDREKWLAESQARLASFESTEEKAELLRYDTPS